MPQFEFLDRIVNTISLQTKPASKFKKKTTSYFYDTDSLQVFKKLNSNSYLADFTFLNVNTRASLLSTIISSSIFSVPTDYIYMNSSTSIEIDYFSPQTTQEKTETLLFFSQEASANSLHYLNESAQLNYLLNSYTAYTDLNQYTDISLINSSESLLVASIQDSYQDYPIGSAASVSLNTPAYIYVQKVNDDLILALDLQENLIIEYTEPQDVEEYVPPNPEDLIIITLKEFWG
jgi:hypothetical protein